MNSKAEFEQLYKQYFNYVMFIVAQQLPRTEDREDTVSEVFIDLWKLFENLDNTKNVKSLLFTITKRRIYDFLRKHYRLQEKELPTIEESEFVNKESEATELPILNKVQKLVGKLGLKYQKLFKLKYIEHVSNSSIAKEMGISLNYVKVLNNRLIKQLKKLWNNQT